MYFASSMECVYIKSAQYLKEFKIFLKFNTGETGEVDLKDIVFNNKIAKPLRKANTFSMFYLDSWPTLAWDCGFDVSPELLYSKAIEKPKKIK